MMGSDLLTRWRRRHEPKAPNGRYLADVIEEITSRPYGGIFYLDYNLSPQEREDLSDELIERQLRAVVRECPQAASLVLEYLTRPKAATL